MAVFKEGLGTLRPKVEEELVRLEQEGVLSRTKFSEWLLRLCHLSREMARFIFGVILK